VPLEINRLVRDLDDVIAAAVVDASADYRRCLAIEELFRCPVSVIRELV
jgi:hypothetical protein